MLVGLQTSIQQSAQTFSESHAFRDYLPAPIQALCQIFSFSHYKAKSCSQFCHSRVTLLQMGLIQSLVFPQPSTHHSALPDQCFSPACWPSIQADAQMLNDKYQSPGKYQNKCDSGTNHPWVLTPDLTRDFSASLNPRQMPQPPPVRVIFLHTLTHRYHHSMARRMTLLGELSSSQPSSQFPCSFPFP